MIRAVILKLSIIILFGVSRVNGISVYDIPELKYLNEDIDPCDNFYEFTCSNFPNYHPLPDGKQLWDHFTILQQDIHTLAKDILATPRITTESIAIQKAKAFYTSCLDVNSMEPLNNGYSSIVNFINQHDRWPAISADYDDTEVKLSWAEMARLTADYGLSFYFSFSVVPALFNPSRNAILIETDILKNPDASGVRPIFPYDTDDFLRKKTDDDELLYATFLRNVAFRLRDLIGNLHTTDEYIVAELNDTIKYMEIVNNSGIKNDDVSPLAPETTLGKLQAWTDKYFGSNFLNWEQYLNIVIAGGDVILTPDTIVLFQPSPDVMYGLLNLYKQSTARQIKNYVIARLLTYMAPDSDKYIRTQYRQFATENNDTVYSRVDYCVRKTLGFSGNIDFSLAVTHEYKEYYFDDSKFEKAVTMMSDIFNSFIDMVQSSEWMDKEAKEWTLNKANKMFTLLGYPEDVVNKHSSLNAYYDDMKVCTWDHYGNAQRLRSFQMQKKMKPIGGKKERNNWNSSPLEVNAFYNKGNNRITLPISMLNGVFFNGKYSVLDYARLGAVVGHEITHGYDQIGKNFGADGELSLNTWSENTTNAYNTRVKCFENQYNNYHIDEINANVNGYNTVNENLADNGGLKIAYKAYQKLMTIEHHDYINEGKYSLEQLFFIAYGTMWCTEATNYYLDVMNQQGTYAPGRFRVIGPVSNMPEFAEAFQCPKGSNMNPIEQCQLW